MSSWYELMREIELAFSRFLSRESLAIGIFESTHRDINKYAFSAFRIERKESSSNQKNAFIPSSSQVGSSFKKLTEPRKLPITKPKSAVRNAKPMPLLSELHPNQLFSAEVYFKLFQELAPAPLEFTVFATALEENQALVKSYEKKPPPSIIAIITYLEQCSKYHIVIKPEVLLQPFHFHG